MKTSTTPSSCARIFGAFRLAEIETDPAAVEAPDLRRGCRPDRRGMAGQIRDSPLTLSGRFRSMTRRRRASSWSTAERPLPVRRGLKHQDRRPLPKLGVEMKMNAFVTDVDSEGVTLKYKSGEEERIRIRVQGVGRRRERSPLGRALGGGSHGPRK